MKQINIQSKFIKFTPIKVITETRAYQIKFVKYETEDSVIINTDFIKEITKISYKGKYNKSVIFYKIWFDKGNYTITESTYNKFNNILNVINI